MADACLSSLKFSQFFNRDEKRQNVLEDNGEIFLWFLLNNDQFSVNLRMQLSSRFLHLLLLHPTKSCNLNRLWDLFKMNKNTPQNLIIEVFWIFGRII